MPHQPISNEAIADRFALLSKLMDIHGDNSFKARSYSSAAFAIENLTQPLHTVPEHEMANLKGIGVSTAGKIMEILKTGSLKVLDQLVAATPPGVLEMLRIKGLGPKKIATVWKEMEIETLGELLYACQENRLMLYKGFGAKTQQNVQEAIEFYNRNQDRYLFAEVEEAAFGFTELLRSTFPDEWHSEIGELRRQSVIIDQPAWLTTADPGSIGNFLKEQEMELLDTQEKDIIRFKGAGQLPCLIQSCNKENFYQHLFQQSCSDEFWTAWKTRFPSMPAVAASEASIFQQAGVSFIPPAIREKASILSEAETGKLPEWIQSSDIRGIIHCHSNWSDGSHSLEEMALACKQRGLEYIVISDHSKSAFYAKGLNEDRIRDQHAQIDALNMQLAPFKIFKSIECDILNDGSMDYNDEVLATFDLVIASIHSNLKMPLEKAMMRLTKAIENPYTTILGHMTGRLLLSRPGYPVDHEAIIDLCSKHGVVIELNAHPRRLDIDWTWISHAMDKKVLLSIDPDAHSIEGLGDVRYGVLAAQKGGLTKAFNLSSFSLDEIGNFIANRKKAKGL